MVVRGVGWGQSRFSSGDWEPWGRTGPVILVPDRRSVFHHSCPCGEGLPACCPCTHNYIGPTQPLFLNAVSEITSISGGLVTARWSGPSSCWLFPLPHHPVSCWPPGAVQEINDTVGWQGACSRVQVLGHSSGI